MRLFIRAAIGALALSTLAAGVAAAQGTSAPSAPSAPLRIGYVNSQKIIAQAPGRAEAESQFRKEMDTYKAEVKSLGDSLNTMVAEYNKAESTLSPAAKEGKQKEIRGKESAYQQRVRELEQKAQQREAELVRPIMEQINKTIEQVRAEEGYAMVFDAGSQAGVVVAADSSLDLTDKVIARLKSAGPVASTQAKPAQAKPAQAKPAPKPSGAPTSKPTGVTRPKTPPLGR
jgi:outer membrane protein